MDLAQNVKAGHGFGPFEHIELVDEELQDDKFLKDAPRKVINEASSEEDLNIDWMDDKDEEGKTEGGSKATSIVVGSS